ncbi:hypothetical protein ACB092_11G181600 [Castanea dentata]
MQCSVLVFRFKLLSHFSIFESSKFYLILSYWINSFLDHRAKPRCACRKRLLSFAMGSVGKDHRAKPRCACRKRLLSFAMGSVGKEFETTELMKLSVLYDLVEWVVGSGAGVGSNWQNH